MKRLLALALTAMMTVSLAACGAKASTSTAASTAAGSTAASAAASTAASGASGSASGKLVYVVTALGDMSFNDSGEVGMKTLKQQGYTEQTIETGDDASKYDAFIQDACDAGCDYMIVSSTYQEQVEKVASQYPKMHFIVFDIAPDTKVAADNILYIAFKQNEASYLGGIVAAGLSKSGHIGAVGGIENPVINDFMAGYIDGAMAYNKDIKVSTAFIGDWTNSAKMLELCTQQNSSYGTDVFFPIAGGAGTGAFEAAQKLSDVWTLGVDSDQYAIFKASNNSMSDVIATSVTKEVGNTMVELFKDPSTIKWGSVVQMGIKEGAVGLSENDYYKEKVPEAVRTAVDTAKSDISSGKITAKSYFGMTEDEYKKLVSSVAP
jgi:basic membrane protein A